MKGISIIITAYKAFQFIEDTLNSVYLQTYFSSNDFEVIIGIDACKTTYEKIYKIQDKYKNLKVYFFTDNKGTYILRNTLIGHTKFNKVLFFDADDIMNPTMVETIMGIDHSYIMLHCHKKEDNTLSEQLTPVAGVFCIDKNMFELFGGFMPWKCSADGEFHERMKRNNFNPYIISESLFIWNVHDKSLSHHTDTNNKSEIRRKYYEYRRHFELIKLNKIIKTTTEDYIEIKTNEKYNFKLSYTNRRLGVIYNVFDETNILTIALENIRKVVDFICVVYQNVSYTGISSNKNIYYELRELKNKGLIDIIVPFIPNLKISPKLNEVKKRNLGINYCDKNNCNYIICLDGDELFKTEELDYAKSMMYENSEYDLSVCKMLTYYHNTETIIYPPEEYYIPFIIKLDERRFQLNYDMPFPIDKGRRIPFSNCKEFTREEIQMHHYSFVMKDINKKLLNQPTPIPITTKDKILETWNNFKDGEKACTNNGYFQTKKVINPFI